MSFHALYDRDKTVTGGGGKPVRRGCIRQEKRGQIVEGKPDAGVTTLGGHRGMRAAQKGANCLLDSSKSFASMRGRLTLRMEQETSVPPFAAYSSVY